MGKRSPGSRGHGHPTRGEERGPVVSGAAGFTVIQLLLSLVVISIVGALAQPFLHRAGVQGRAKEVVAELQAVGMAAREYRTQNGAWPQDGSRGQVPPGLASQLPAGFSFRKPEYILDFDSWAGEAGAPFAAGVTFITQDPELGRAVLDLLASGVWSDGRSKYTWVIEG